MHMSKVSTWFKMSIWENSIKSYLILVIQLFSVHIFIKLESHGISLSLKFSVTRLQDDICTKEPVWYSLLLWVFSLVFSLENLISNEEKA